MLTSHGGEIFVHTLSTARSVLEDPPAISEMAGGRVGDYRIEDLKDAILLNRLAPHLRLIELISNVLGKGLRTRFLSYNIFMLGTCSIIFYIRNKLSCTYM